MIKRRSLWVGIGGLVLVVGGFLLARKPAETVEEKPRTDFFIQTLSLGTATGETVIRKTGRIVGASQLTISALTAGRVQRLPVQLGARVGVGAQLVSLIDTQGSTIFRAQNAGLSIQSAQNTYEIQKKNLEKQIADLKIAQERAQLSYTNTAGKTGNTTTLQISGLEQNLAKTKFDYETKIKTDAVTINNNIATAKNVYADTMNLLIDVTDQADDIVHVRDPQLRTQQYIYFAGKNDTIKANVETQLRDLIAKKTMLQEKGNAITEETIQEYLSSYRTYLDAVNAFVTTMKEGLVNSIVDTRYLSEAQLAAYTASFGAAQAKASGVTASITAQVNGLQSFLSSYKDQQQSLKTQIAILENDIAVRKSQLTEQATNSELSLESSNGNVDFATQTKNLNLQTLQNALAQAQLALDEANFNAAKLSVRAPIAGEISDVLVDVGQDVSVGTPLLTMVSEGKEIEVLMTQAEMEGLMIGSKVELKDDYTQGEGVVVSLGNVAEKSGNFPVNIRVTKGDFAIGGFVQVLLGTKREGLLVPINTVTIVDNGVGQIVLRDGTNLETVLVTLGETFGTVVEVKDSLPTSKQLVISDITNYDSQKMTIKVK